MLIIVPIGTSGGFAQNASATNTTNGLKIITSALRKLTVIPMDGSPSPEEEQVGFEALNQLVDDLRTQRAFSPGMLRAAYPLQSGVQQYTIGAGGTFNQAWPEEIALVSVTPDRTAETPQEIILGQPLNSAEFQSLTQKGATAAYPSATFYDRAWTNGLGRIWVYPVPTISLADLVLYTPHVLGTFATLTTQYQLRPGLIRLLINQLAVEVAPEFDTEASETVKGIAVKALANQKRANFEAQPAEQDARMPGLRGGGAFNVWTGSR